MLNVGKREVRQQTCVKFHLGLFEDNLQSDGRPAVYQGHQEINDSNNFGIQGVIDSELQDVSSQGIKDLCTPFYVCHGT